MSYKEELQKLEEIRKCLTEVRTYTQMSSSKAVKYKALLAAMAEHVRGIRMSGPSIGAWDLMMMRLRNLAQLEHSPQYRQSIMNDCIRPWIKTMMPSLQDQQNGTFLNLKMVLGLIKGLHRPMHISTLRGFKSSVKYRMHNIDILVQCLNQQSSWTAVYFTQDEIKSIIKEARAIRIKYETEYDHATNCNTPGSIVPPTTGLTVAKTLIVYQLETPRFTGV